MIDPGQWSFCCQTAGLISACLTSVLSNSASDVLTVYKFSLLCSVCSRDVIAKPHCLQVQEAASNTVCSSWRSFWPFKHGPSVQLCGQGGPIQRQLWIDSIACIALGQQQCFKARRSRVSTGMWKHHESPCLCHLLGLATGSMCGEAGLMACHVAWLCSQSAVLRSMPVKKVQLHPPLVPRVFFVLGHKKVGTLFSLCPGM